MVALYHKSIKRLRHVTYLRKKYFESSLFNNVRTYVLRYLYLNVLAHKRVSFSYHSLIVLSPLNLLNCFI